MDLFGERLIGVLDGSNLVYRVAAVLNLSFRGEPVSVIYGFCTTLISIQKRFNFTEIYVCWDKGLSERRLKILKTYKKKELTEEEKQRRKEIKRQIEVCKEICQCLGIYSLSFENTEADDIIYAVCQIAPGKKIVVSTDKDFFQLVSSSISVYNPVKNEMYNEKNFVEKVGIRPQDFVFFRSIVGDSSDRIVGVRGIGEKRARKLLNEYEVNEILSQNVSPDDLKITKKIVAEIDRVADNCELISFARVENDLFDKVRQELKKGIKIDFSELDSILQKYQFNIPLAEFEIFLRGV